MKITKSKSSAENPFDYLQSLKAGGAKAVRGDDFDPSALASSRSVIAAGNFDDAEIDIAKQIRETVDSKIIVPKDMKIDDGDMPTAANFYEWVTEERFGAVDEERPFLEQLIWGIITFNDFCTHCSDVEWLFFDHKPDDTYAKFERKVSLLHHGVCPNCKRGRSQMVANGEMKFINELAVNAGQRCVVGSTPVLTEFGVLRISECMPDAEYQFSDLEIGVHNGSRLETTSQFFRAEPEKIYRVRLSNGVSIAGTADHPIKTEQGFVILSQLDVGLGVDVEYGQRQWGTGKLDSPRALGQSFYSGDVGIKIRTAREKDVAEFLRGVFKHTNRTFVNRFVISDISALLFNLGIYHSIDGATIFLTDESWAHLHEFNYQTGKFRETIVSIEIESEQETFDFTLPETHQFVTGGIISHNSGKSHTVGGYLFPYLTHRMLKMQKPAQFYGLSRTTVLHSTFVALTYVQAKDTLWTPYYGSITSSSWFQQYHSMLRFYENKHGESLLKLNDTFVVYKPRGIMIYPSGPDKRVLRGRCLRASTMLNTSAGFLSAGELIKKSGYHKVSGFEMDSHKGRVKVSHTYKDKSKTIRAETRNGYHVEGTPEHPMLVLTPDLRFKWIPLDEMKVGDWIVSRTNKNDPMFGDNRAVSKDMATIMGYYVANGYRSEISSNDSAVINNLYEKYQKVTGYIPTFAQADARYRANVHHLHLNGTGVFARDYLRPLGITSSLAKDKEIPRSIRTAPFEIFHEFLESYFECDSGINGGGGPNDAPWEIEVGSASRKLARQLHILLLHAYGIVGRLRKHVFYDRLDKATGLFNGERTHWCVTITGYDAMRFLNTFKRAKVQQYRNRFRNVPPGFASDRRSIPYVREYVYDTYENARLQNNSGKKLRTYVREDGSIYSTKKKGLPRPRFIKNFRPAGSSATIEAPIAEFAIYDEDWDDVLNVLGQFSTERARRIRILLEQGAHFEEVVSIKEKSKKVFVYDVTIPGTHAFTANGLVSHNTRFGASIDEIAYFDSNKDSNKVKVNAHEVYDAMTNSLYTLRAAADRLINNGFNDVFPGYSMNVTSPVARNDMIHVLMERAKTSDSMYAVHRPTWEVNPDFPRNSRLIVDAYRKDPDSADKNFGANPPLIANPFISNHDLIIAAEDRDRKNCVKLDIIMKNSRKQGQSYMYSEVAKVKKSGKPSMMAIDAGLTDNSFAMAGGRLDGINLKVDFATEVIPAKGYKINHSLVYSETILPIMQARNCRILLADRWNSAKLLDDAKLDMGDPDDDMDTFIATNYSLKYRDMVSIRTCLEQGIIRLPKSEIKVTSLLEVLDSDYRDFYDGKPIAHLFKQLYTIKDLEKQVGKGDGYTDDIWRAVALLVWGLMEEEYQGILMEEPTDMTIATPPAIAFSRLYSGGSGQVGQGGGSQTMINGAPLGVMGRAKR